VALEPKECDAIGCKGVAHFNDNCGAWVCSTCGEHRNFVRCYCGWSQSGADGRRELIEMGERIDSDY